MYIDNCLLLLGSPHVCMYLKYLRDLWLRRWPKTSDASGYVGMLLGYSLNIGPSSECQRKLAAKASLLPLKSFQLHSNPARVVELT